MLHVRVVVRHVDELRATLVGNSRDRPRQVLLTQLGRDHDDLSGLHVRAELDDQPGETLAAFVHAQAIVTGARMRFM